MGSMIKENKQMKKNNQSRHDRMKQDNERDAVKKEMEVSQSHRSRVRNLKNLNKAQTLALRHERNPDEEICLHLPLSQGLLPKSMNEAKNAHRVK